MHKHDTMISHIAQDDWVKHVTRVTIHPQNDIRNAGNHGVVFSAVLLQSFNHGGIADSLWSELPLQHVPYLRERLFGHPPE